MTANLKLVEGGGGLETVPEADLRSRAKALKGQIDRGYFELAGILARIYSLGVFRNWGFHTWDEYIRDDLEMSPRKAQYLLSIWQWFDNVLDDPEVKEKVQHLGWCLSPETDIQTARGVKQVWELVPGDLVFDPDSGGMTKVVGVLVEKQQEMFGIDVCKVGKLKANIQHGFDGVRDGVNVFCRSQNLGQVELGRINVGDMNVGDMLFFPGINQDLYSATGWKEKSDQFFRFVGWYVAEGFTHGGQIRISLGKNAKDEVLRLASIAREEFPDCSIRTNGVDGVFHRVTVSGDGIDKKFNEWFGKGSANKTFPDAFYGLRESAIRSFLKGLHDGDGSISSKAMHVVTTVSKDLAWKTRLLMTRLDVLAGIHESL
jgi:hypothetical protein